MEDRRFASARGGLIMLVTGHGDVAQHEEGHARIFVGVLDFTGRKEDLLRIARRSLHLNVPRVAVNLDHIVEALSTRRVRDLADVAVIAESRVHRVRLNRNFRSLVRGEALSVALARGPWAAGGRSDVALGLPNFGLN